MKVPDCGPKHLHSLDFLPKVDTVYQFWFTLSTMKANHPSVLKFKEASATRPRVTISLEELKAIALSCGADDAGVVSIDRPELKDDLPFILAAMPSTKSILCFVKRMAQAPIKTPARSLANHEFHAATKEIGEVGREIVERLTELGITGLNTAAGFPMEMQEFPGRTWIVAHKPVAEAAGLGKMGIHRNVIHPKFGNFILLNSILLDYEVTEESAPIDYNPCLECMLCVSVCPVGAIAKDGHFDAVACLNHNYREFMGGFVDWVDTVTDSKSKWEYRERVTDQETASLWQSLSTGANYKSAYCMAVCPAGDDIIGRFLSDKSQFVQETVKPLQKKVENVYVVAGSDAEETVLKRFPNKIVRRISSGVRPSSVQRLLRAMPLAFQRGKAKDVRLELAMQFTGDEQIEATIRINDQKLEILPGRTSTADLSITVDSKSWLAFLAGKVSLPSLVLRGKLRFKGDLRLLATFGRCFPS